MRKRVKLKYDAVRGYYVDLPTKRIIDGSFQPVTANLLHADGAYPNAAPAAVLALNPTVEVYLPDDDCRCDGAGVPVDIDVKKIHARYPEWAKRAAPDV